jgi:ribosome-interacting GTPase 1
VSILDDDSLERLKRAAWELTGLMRVYLRAGSPAAPEPIALPAGATTFEVARTIHSDFASQFRAARVWGPSARYDAQRVGREHVLQDGDMVEIILGVGVR